MSERIVRRGSALRAAASSPLVPIVTILILGITSSPGLATQADANTIRQWTAALADPSLEGRGAGTAGLDRAAELIAEWFRGAGIQPGGEDGTYFQDFTPPAPAGQSELILPDGASWGAIRLRNVIGRIPGTGEGWVVVGAHYDHLGRNASGEVFPGADDNASGVAAMCAVAMELASEGAHRRGVLFVAFGGEEAGLLGSRYFADHSPVPLAKVIAMLNLDTVGRMTDDKLYVFAASSAAEFPEALKGVNLNFGLDLLVPASGPFGSDQIAFLEKGVPGLHFFTGPNADYHRPTDTVEKLNVAGIASVAAFVSETVRFLSDRERDLTFIPPGAEKVTPPEGAQARPRRVSLGTIPDMAYSGNDGVPVTGVLPGSPAEKAGIKTGDRIIAVGGEKVASLEDYSAILKSHAPGDEVQVTLVRGAEERTVSVTLVERK